MTAIHVSCRAARSVLAAALVTACGHPAPGTSSLAAADRGSLPPSAWHPPSGQRCGPARLPASLPSVAQLVDTDAVAAVLGGDPMPSGAYALLSLKFDSAGQPTRAAVLETTVPTADGERVATAVANALRTQAASAAAWGVRLRVDAGAPPVLRVGRSEWCPASNVGLVDVQRSGHLATMVQRPVLVPAKWRVVVDEAGTVQMVTLLTATNYRDLARESQQDIARMHFLPALDDRAPVVSVDTISFPIVGVPK